MYMVHGHGTLLVALPSSRCSSPHAWQLWSRYVGGTQVADTMREIVSWASDGAYVCVPGVDFRTTDS